MALETLKNKTIRHCYFIKRQEWNDVISIICPVIYHHRNAYTEGF